MFVQYVVVARCKCVKEGVRGEAHLCSQKVSDLCGVDVQ